MCVCVCVCVGKGWPLNYHLMFDLLAVGSLGGVLLCLLLPSSSEKKRDNLTGTLTLQVTETSESNDVDTIQNK